MAPPPSRPAPGPARFLIQVVPGLEEVATNEVRRAIPEAELVGAWKNFDERASLLEFRASGDPCRWLELGTVEDVFALAARGRALHLDRRGLGELAAATRTSKYLDRAMEAFARCRGKAPRTFRVVARKAGEHAFRRVDAQRAVESALKTRLGRARLVADRADAELWLTVIGQVALLGTRLSTAALRQRSLAIASRTASLKPTVARAMALLSEPRETDVVLDPFAGAGTLLIERARSGGFARLLGGDRDREVLDLARESARASHVPVSLEEWDALALPLAEASVDVVLTNPPFGKKVEIPGGDPERFYRGLLEEIRRVLRPGGRLVLITSQTGAFVRANQSLPSPLKIQQRIPLLVRGERATIFVARG